MVANLKTAFLLLMLEIVFFVPDVTGSAWADEKILFQFDHGALLIVTLMAYTLAYVFKSLVQTRLLSMLILDVLMALVSNVFAAFADIVFFHRSVNTGALFVATVGLLVMGTCVNQLHPTQKPIGKIKKNKKTLIDVFSWVCVLFVSVGLYLPSFSVSTGIPESILVIALSFVAALFSKTGSGFQKFVLRKKQYRKAMLKPKYFRGLLGNLASQVLLAKCSTVTGIAGVSVLRTLFSTAISAGLSAREGDLIWKRGWGSGALFGFAIFVSSRLM